MPRTDLLKRATELNQRLAADISIGALERGVRTFAKQLEKMGLTTEVVVAKLGRGSEAGVSNVRLRVIAKFTKDGNERTGRASLKFVSGGYGSLDDRREIGGGGWRAMKAEGLKRIMKSLEPSGWKKPA